MKPSAPAARPAVRAFVAISTAVLAAIAWGHDDLRAVQLAVLALPGLLWLLWPVASPRWRRLRGLAVAAWSLSFVADGIVRGHIAQAFEAAANSSLVIAAVANTSPRESAEFLAMYAPAIAASAAGLLVLAAVVVAGAWHSARPSNGPAPARPRLLAGALAGLMLLTLLGYASKPWRRWHPVAFWAGWSAEVLDLRASWADHTESHARARERARGAGLQMLSDGPSTVVLVLGDSVNRSNLGLYGYPRNTTPRLDALRARHGDALVVMRHAWSAEAGTLAALRSMFQMHDTGWTEQQHLLAMAHAAGYRSWWISNHDDLGIERLHARLADEVHMVNRMPGRATAMLDGETLPLFARALADPAPRKLIVLHLLGAHPHYRLRHPPGANPFDDRPDAVQQALAAQGRPEWLRRLRDDYDAALLYHDEVVARTLEMTQAAVATDRYAAWLYLSDHGQEVAHEVDRAGHSESTAAGYRIPALLWQSRPRRPLPPGVPERPFRADWTGWTLAHLLGVRWPEKSVSRDVLDPTYRWEPPPLRAPVHDFHR